MRTALSLHALHHTHIRSPTPHSCLRPASDLHEHGWHHSGHLRLCLMLVHGRTLQAKGSPSPGKLTLLSHARALSIVKRRWGRGWRWGWRLQGQGRQEKGPPLRSLPPLVTPLLALLAVWRLIQFIQPHTHMCLHSEQKARVYTLRAALVWRAGAE